MSTSPLPSAMTEQHTSVRDVHGRNITIAPVQVVNEAAGPTLRGWNEALLTGPLARAGLTERANRARELSEDERFAEAAEEFLAIADALRAADYSPAAVAYRARAAEALGNARERESARKLLLELAREKLDGGSIDAQSFARRARELSTAEDQWEADAMLALASWPERRHNDVETLRLAAGRSQGTPREAEWTAAIVEFLILVDDRDTALSVAEETRERLPLEQGDRLRLELDFLDLIEKERARADEAWNRVARWIADPRLPIEAAATAWQRRGVALARRGESDEARVAFLQAVAQWGREPGYDDQAAEAYFSATAADFALGRLFSDDPEARALAGALRGREQTPMSATERLLRRAMRNLVNEKFPDAFRELSLATRIARRAGNLSDYLEAAESLGDCIAKTERHQGMALAAYVVAGQQQKAKAIAEEGKALVDDVLATVPLDGAPWERAAAWAAIAGCRRRGRWGAVVTVADEGLEELECAGPTAFPNAAFWVIESAASLICGMPLALRGRYIEILEERLKARGGDPRTLADPLVMVTAAGIADCTDALIDALLDEEAGIRVSGVGELLKANEEAREKVAVAARGGNSAALEALAFADLLGEDPILVERAEARVRRTIDSPLREVHDEGGIRTVSYGLGTSLGPEGLLARACSRKTREEFVAKQLETLGQAYLPLMARVGAVEGLRNISPSLPDRQVPAVTATLSRLALSEDTPAEMDRLDHDEPLARFKIDMAPPHALRAASIEALSILAEAQGEQSQGLEDAVSLALASGAEPLIVAGLHAVAHHPELGEASVDIGTLTEAPSSRVRVAALAALFHIDPKRSADIAEAMVNDPDEMVRRNLIVLAKDHFTDGRRVLEALQDDPDTFNRAIASAALS